MGAIGRLPKTAWTDALRPDARVDPDAQVAELTGILREGGELPDELDGWPTDLRVIARRTKRPEGKPAKLGEDVDFKFGAFAHLHRRRPAPARGRPAGTPCAHVEDGVKQTKACRGENLAVDELPAQRRLAAARRPRPGLYLPAAADRPGR
jgi:hypothetical protein